MGVRTRTRAASSQSGVHLLSAIACKRWAQLGMRNARLDVGRHGLSNRDQVADPPGRAGCVR
eukprot:3432292-Alexandrium_andersonii.AAC.1